MARVTVYGRQLAGFDYDAKLDMEPERVNEMIFPRLRVALFVSVLVLAAGVSACVGESQPASSAAVTDGIELRVHKTATCGCCGAWVSHIEQRGFVARVINHEDLSGVKAKYQIPPKYQSCHTAISKEGYVFEGHIPAKIIRRFLAEKPADTLGLTVPGMPVGSPGMEYEAMFNPYQVLMLKADGTVEVFAEVQRAEDQY